MRVGDGRLCGPVLSLAERTHHDQDQWIVTNDDVTLCWDSLPLLKVVADTP
jgi:hypothetical protein